MPWTQNNAYETFLCHHVMTAANRLKVALNNKHPLSPGSNVWTQVDGVSLQSWMLFWINAGQLFPWKTLVTTSVKNPSSLSYTMFSTLLNKHKSKPFVRETTHRHKHRFRYRQKHNRQTDKLQTDWQPQDSDRWKAQENSNLDSHSLEPK